jgi:mRNA interferase MazF
MGQPAVGAIVAVDFPYSDGSGSKKRPALVIADADERDVIVCQITSKRYSSQNALALPLNDLATGSLPVASFIHVEKLFTISRGVATTVLATVSKRLLRAARQTAADLFSEKP